jgi:hypothetical protein
MDIAKKLQLRAEQRLVMAHAPASVAPTLQPLTSLPRDAAEPALLVFALNRAALQEDLEQVVASALADRLTWVAYPKSGQLGTDLNRDSLAATLTASGLQPVRQIAIDDVWSALRFRPATE